MVRVIVGATGLALLICVAACGGFKSEHPAPSWGNDGDKDGVLDPKDDCKDKAEDIDGYKDRDGCPDEDNDGDKVVDKDDQCPNVKGETPHGCPGITEAIATAKLTAADFDRDGDGILKGADRCDDKPEDFDNIQDDDGCPEDDADGDTIPDTADQCPLEPEDGKMPAPRDGCKLKDADRDGVPDGQDNCKYVAGIAPTGCPACAGTWRDSERMVSVTKYSGYCGRMSIKSGDMTCSGSLSGCSVRGSSMSGSFSCRYDKVNRTVSGSMSMTCNSQAANVSVRVSGNTQKWTLSKR